MQIHRKRWAPGHKLHGRLHPLMKTLLRKDTKRTLHVCAKEYSILLRKVPKSIPLWRMMNDTLYICREWIVCWAPSDRENSVHYSLNICNMGFVLARERGFLAPIQHQLTQFSISDYLNK